MAETAEPNELIHESSPYLLQHAYNPVQWIAFGEKAFSRAKAENKLVLVSVGYSACHWCHVMEHESFEDQEVAELMNRHFVCVKVDREERADVDMLYMQAVQLMSGQGGWPMNCFVLPDGKPCYGGTYFPKQQWMQILTALSDLYEKQPQKVMQYAEELTRGILHAESYFEGPASTKVVEREEIRRSVQTWSKQFDNEMGGSKRAPKFPMPANYRFLLRYAILANETPVLDHVKLTLDKMALGGIFDQVHGGFARYSVDHLWKVPHFEKMLYDNAQLASLYLEAFAHTKSPLYARIAREVLDFVKREWLSPEGGFYSAFDADSEGVEGRYYVWSKAELEKVLGEDFAVFSRHFEINGKGSWEHGNYILMRQGGAQAMDAASLQTVDRCILKLREAAGVRVKPGLDDKVITAWNALMCSAYCQAYLILGDETYRKIALQSVQFILTKLSTKDGRVFRTYKSGKARITAFLDDYAFITEALINCYYLTRDESLLEKAALFTQEVFRGFHNAESVFFYYTSTEGDKLIARSTEVSDNVIPSSNAQMAHNLTVLGSLLDRPDWRERAGQMLSAVSGEMLAHGAAYGHWSSLALMHAWPLNEIALVGKHVDEKLKAIYSATFTNTIFAVSAGHSELPLLRDKFQQDQTLYYVCRNKTCSLPVNETEEALKLLD